MNNKTNSNFELSDKYDSIDAGEFQYFSPNIKSEKNDYLKLEDADIYYEVRGEGPAIIFIHGLGGNHLSWWQQVPYFSDRYKCINYSQRGFANSKNYSNRIGHEVFAEDLNALIDRLNLEEVYLVAQSMGGWTALAYTFNNPKKVKAIVMASTSGIIDFKKTNNFDNEKLKLWEKWAEDEKKNLKEKEILNAVGEAMTKENPSLSYNYEQIYNLTPYSYKEFIRTDIKRKRVQSPEIMNEINMPLLFITGEHDLLFPSIGGEILASSLNNAKFKMFKNTGHSAYFERAKEFNQTVEDFLSPLTGIPKK